MASMLSPTHTASILLMMLPSLILCGDPESLGGPPPPGARRSPLYRKGAAEPPEVPTPIAGTLMNA